MTHTSSKQMQSGMKDEVIAELINLTPQQLSALDRLTSPSSRMATMATETDPIKRVALFAFFAAKWFAVGFLLTLGIYVGVLGIEYFGGLK